MPTARVIVWPLVLGIAVLTIAYVYSVRPKDGSRPPPRICFITGGDGPFWQNTIAGARQAAKEYEVKLQVEAPDNGAEGQFQILSRLSAEQFDGVAISPQDPGRQAEWIRRLTESLKVVTYDSDAPTSDRLCYIGTNNLLAGRISADLAKQALPRGGEIAVLITSFDKDNAALRYEGFTEELHRRPASDAADGGELETGVEAESEVETAVFPNYEIVTTMEDQEDWDKCRQNIRAVIQDHPEVDCIVGLAGFHGALLLEVLKAENRLGQIRLVTFDEAEPVLEGIADGHIYATVAQDPFMYGYEAVRTLSDLHQGRFGHIPLAGRGAIYLLCEPVSKDNLEEFRARLVQRARAMQAGT